MKYNLLLAIFCLSALDVVAQEKIIETPNHSATALTTVAALDLPRYMGTWYEIAKFPNRFQKKCVGNTRAEYTLRADGKVEVINRCRQDNGEMKEAVGMARQLGASTSAKLEVCFAPWWLCFVPAVWGNYWVIDLDGDYQLAAVSEPSREYLWVLSRTPKVNPEMYERLLQRLTGKGFDINKLVTTHQE